MQARETVVAAPWRAGPNHFDTGGRCMAVTVQVDRRVFVVGQDDFDALEYDIDAWNQQADEEPVEYRRENGASTLAILNEQTRDRTTWQCGSCDAWVCTSNRPQIEVADRAVCGRPGGVDSVHAYRHPGPDDY